MDSLFFLKKLLGLLLMPSAMIFFIILIAWFCYRKGLVKFARLLGLLGCVAYYLLSTSAVPNMLISALERDFPAYDGRKVDYVLVLGGWHASSPAKPLSSILGSESLNRLTEGLMIYRSNPGSKLLLSGYKARDSISHAKAASQVAVALGVPEEDIFLAEKVKDTAEEAKYWVEFISGKTMALVTTASHMPRSIYLFEKELKLRNMSTQLVVPAPTHFTGCINDCFAWPHWIPRGDNLASADAAWHEYLGLIWARLQPN